MYDAKFWGEAWRDARQSSSLGTGYKNEAAWQDFWNFFSGHYALRNRQTRQLEDEVVNHLCSLGMINKDSEVLDVGCGPGTYTLPLAEKCRKVTGMDSAAVMLEVLQKEGEHFGVAHRLEALLADWVEYGGERKWDLVVAAKTPAVRDCDTLLKMCRVAGQCCLITFAGNVIFSLRNLLWQEVMGSPLKSRAFDMQYPFNILYREGYFPNVKFFRQFHRYLEDVEYLIEHYACYFKIFGRSGDAVERQIKEFLTARAVNGKCEDTTDAVITVMCWKTDRQTL